MKYDHVFFDLDGTITDPAVGVTDSVAYALQKFGITVKDRQELYPFIGPPLVESFSRFYGFTPEQAWEAVSYYREYYPEKGIYACTVYEGIPALLCELHAAGVQVILATSKPEIYARPLMEHFGLDRYFSLLAGATLGPERNTKDAVLSWALTQCPDLRPERAVMVGDRHYDINGAKKFHLHSVGVLFGYGSREELVQAGAEALAEDVPQLRRILLG